MQIFKLLFIITANAQSISIMDHKSDNTKAILEVYLPKQLTPSEIEAFIIEYVRDGGKPAAMKALKEQYAGQYDGKLASTIIDNLILSWSVV